MEMNALHLIGPRKFQVVKTSIPTIPENCTDSILMRTEWLSVCGSDIAFFNGGKRSTAYPLYVGAPVHECVGQVMASTSAGFQQGDWVLAIPEGNQGLAEFFLARESRALGLPFGLERYDTCCLIQPLATVLNAVDRLGNVSGRSVTIVGLGSIGLMFCWLLKQRGASLVMGIDPCEERCRVAEIMGADCAYPVRGIEYLHNVRQEAGWDAPDIVIEAVGHQSQTINDCLRLVQKEGTVLAFGVPDSDVYAIDYEVFFRKNIHLVAAVTPKWSDYLPKACDLFLANRAALEPLFTHRFPIAFAGQAFDCYENHEGGIIKALINASCWGRDCEDI
jgi:L-iditol 2-dehydrogenase